MENKIGSYEEALKGLLEMAEKIKDKNLSLEETIKCYEEGMARYEACKKIIEEAKQTISKFNGEIS